MAIVADKKDADRFIALAANENLEAAVVARVTDKRRLVMKWRGKTIVSISRDFLNSAGAEKHASVKVRQNKAGADAGKGPPPPPASLKERFAEMAADLNVCGKKGLFERFDSTIGSLSVLMPAGGVYQLTPAQCMAAKLPADGGTETCSGMAFGFDPFVAAENPYEGAYIAVLESIARLVAAGFPASGVYLSLQEYFPRPRDDEERWGLPFAALLGALQAQLDFGAAAIGGKDSMSGSFESLDVPPSLVAFAVAVGKAGNIIGGELKAAGHQVVRISPDYRSRHRPEAASFTSALKLVERLILAKTAVSVYTPGRFGAAEALFKMSVGNRLGVSFEGRIDADRLFASAFGSFIVELNGGLSAHDITGEGVSIEPLGVTTDAYTFVINGETVPLSEVQEVWEAKLEGLFPYRASSGAPDASSPPIPIARSVPPVFQIRKGGGKPRALIPVFPGTNCEYDTARALREAGADAETFVVRNLTPRHVAESAALLAEKIGRAQMLVLPGGFSGGDEPDGSAKLIAAFLRGRAVADAVSELLETRDGLILGICNGFQALIKLGLVPFGAIRDSAGGGPTLTFNRIGRHQSLLVRTRVCSALSPWLLCEEVGAVHTLPVSHGEGRFAADPALALRLAEAGQIAAQYVGPDGSPSMDPRFNPAGSMMAVEALSDPSGRVLGKMAHSERSGANLYKNVPGNKRQRLFEGGVKYFSG
jgi:phosphoribosylformylglycinamidine synthase